MEYVFCIYIYIYMIYAFLQVKYGVLLLARSERASPARGDQVFKEKP